MHRPSLLEPFKLLNIWPLKSNAALALNACLLDGVHLAPDSSNPVAKAQPVASINMSRKPLAAAGPPSPSQLPTPCSLRTAVTRASGNMGRAAKSLGIHRNTLRNKIMEYGIEMAR